MIDYTDFLSDQLLEICQQDNRQLVVITDDNVGPLYADSLLKHLAPHAKCITIPNGEPSKSRETKAWIEDELFQLGCGRDTRLIALGGGVITDLVGFVAATFCRGVPVIYIPTSLLAMVDAAIGGKTGINTPSGKNLIGTFTEPEAVLIDIKLLNTLPTQEYTNALSEIIKHALITDKSYFEYIHSNIKAIEQKKPDVLLRLIQRSIEIKSEVVSADAKEQSKREILNFGHTIAHAIETCSDYQIHHGQAVTIGLIVESYLSYQMGLLKKADLIQIKALITELKLPLDLGMIDSKQAILKAFTQDKKTRQSKPRFVLLEQIGMVYQVDGAFAHPVEIQYMNQAIDYLFDQFIDNIR
ncbi:MAG: 3-dehydroquinate synthase [Gammaproteobacteria bacterium]|nr:3-dehydroquinate synthase [Gammaproteobacteria bacterium]